MVWRTDWSWIRCGTAQGDTIYPTEEVQYITKNRVRSAKCEVRSAKCEVRECEVRSPGVRSAKSGSAKRGDRECEVRSPLRSADQGGVATSVGVGRAHCVVQPRKGVPERYGV